MNKYFEYIKGTRKKYFLRFLFHLILFLFCIVYIQAANWSSSDFPISFWCGPPGDFLNKEQFQVMKEAGFNYVMPSCEGKMDYEQNRKILNLAQKTGLKVFIKDRRMPLSVGDSSIAHANLDSMIRDYGKHPALAGYFITDEPNAREFPGLGEVVSYMRKKDPQHLAYINLYPNYANSQQLGTANYEEYLEQYVKTVKPDVISYDHYHFLKGGDRPGFFENLESIRNVALKYNLPFWNIVLLIPHFNYRSLTYAELQFEAMQTLVYGGKGLLYFTYWTPPNGDINWSPAMIDREGKPTKHYKKIQKINPEVMKIGSLLKNTKSLEVIHGDTTFSSPLPNPEVIFPESTPVSVGIFQDARNKYFLFTNKNYKNAVMVKARLVNANQSLRLLDYRHRNKWKPVSWSQENKGYIEILLELSPGSANLFRCKIP